MTAVWDRESASGLQLAVRDPAIPSPGELLGESQMFLDALAATRRLLRRESPIIFLQGEPGTGRTLFARRIHYEGPAPEDPFIAVQCASLPPTLLEIELFGSPADPFAGAERTRGILEVAGKGTVFLDEVQDLPVQIRHRLVVLLHDVGNERPVHCRIVAASRGKPDPDVTDDRLAREFDELLQENMVELPPLRSRERDLELLSRHFLRRWARDNGSTVPVLESGALEALYAYTWPGNVRELSTVLERAASLSPGRRIGPEHLRIKARRNEPLEGNAPPAADMILIPADGKKLADIEAEAVRASLRLTSGNRSAAARMLGISRPTLSRKIQKYRLHTDEKRG